MDDIGMQAAANTSIDVPDSVQQFYTGAANEPVVLWCHRITKLMTTANK